MGPWFPIQDDNGELVTPYMGAVAVEKKMQAEINGYLAELHQVEQQLAEKARECEELKAELAAYREAMAA